MTSCLKVLLFTLLRTAIYGQGDESYLRGLPPQMKSEFRAFLGASFDKKRFAHTLNPKGGKNIYHLEYPDDMTFKEGIGYAQRPNLLVHHAARTTDKILFKASYKYNKWGRRVVLPPGTPAKEHFILAGASFALGIGLNNQESLSYQLLKERPQYQEVNIAVGGSGPNTMLAIVQTELKKSVYQDSGHFLYVYNDFHIERSNGFAQQRLWLYDSPWFEEESNGTLVNKGPFKEARPYSTWIYKRITDLFSLLGLGYNFPRRSQGHIDYTCALIKETKRVYLTHFPRGQFSVYAHPFSPMDSSMKECLKNAAIKTIHSTIKWRPEEHEIPFEKHPNATGCRAVAREISQNLAFSTQSN